MGTPIILTEIMTTSIYKQFQRIALTQTHILGISQDVASTLNYFHLWKLSLIIHRDISSPNFLLEQSVEENFKTKVTDYEQLISNNKQRRICQEIQPMLHQSHVFQMIMYRQWMCTVYSVLLMDMILHCPPAVLVMEREQEATRVL